MADKKISELTAVTSLAHSDAFPLYDASATATRKATLSTLFGGAYFPNASATDQGATGNSDTVKYAVDTISSDYGMIVLRNNSGSATTTYTFSTNETIPANIILVLEYGALISVDTGKTLTIYSPANIKAQATQQIFSGAGTVAFSSGGGNIYPDWWKENTSPGTTDMTDALTAAAVAQDSTEWIYQSVLSSGYIGGGSPIVLQSTKYLISEDITGFGYYPTIIANGASILQSVVSENILDFANSRRVYIKGPLELSGGNTQVRIGNNNINVSSSHLIDVRFSDSGDYAFETYLVAPATGLSMTAVLDNCDFKEPYQAAYIEGGASVEINGGWIQVAYSDATHAIFTNKGNLQLNRVFGVPNATITPTGGRWIDNYGEVTIDNNTRLGGEGGGMPVVYQYDKTRSNYTDGGAIRIHNSDINCGNGSVKQTLVHLVDGVPSLISIKDNERLYISTGSIISVEAGFDVAAYLAALNVLDKIFIEIDNNSSYLPLESVGLPATLLADKKRVRVGRSFAPYSRGSGKQSLLHFDGADASTSIADEYFGYWSVAGNAALTTTTPRFLGSSLSLPDATSYIKNDGSITDIGDAFTFEFWFRITDNSTNAYIFKAIASVYGIILYHVGASNKLALYASSDGASWDIANGTLGTKADYANGTWYKVAIEFTGSRYSVYVGAAGSAVAEDIGVASTDSICAVNKMFIGNSATGLIGAVAEFRMILDDYRYWAIFIPEAEPFKVN